MDVNDLRACLRTSYRSGDLRACMVQTVRVYLPMLKLLESRVPLFAGPQSSVLVRLPDGSPHGPGLRYAGLSRTV